MTKLTTINGKLRRHAGGSGYELVYSRDDYTGCCCCNVKGLKLKYAAGGSDGHQCDAAKFTCLVAVPGGEEVEIGEVNLNNNSTGAEIVVELTITAEQAHEITKDASDCCALVARLRCETPPEEDYGWGLGLCHTNLARLRVTAQNNAGCGLVVFNGTAGEAVVSLSTCPLSRVLYSPGGSWSSLASWFEDEGFSLPAECIPDAQTIVYVYGDMTGSGVAAEVHVM